MYDRVETRPPAVAHFRTNIVPIQNGQYGFFHLRDRMQDGGNSTNNNSEYRYKQAVYSGREQSRALPGNTCHTVVTTLSIRLAQ